MRFGYLAILLVLAGCATIDPPRDHTTLNKINDELKQASEVRGAESAVPPAVSSALLPPLKIAVPKATVKQLEQRFDLVINDAPVNQVFMGIVSGTRYSVLVHPDVKGNISVNLKDVTVTEALESLRQLYGYEYRIEGSRIYVLKPGMQAKVYKINYIVGMRRGRSDLVVTSGASGESSSNSTTSTASSTVQSQASSIASSQRADFWSEIEDSLRTVLGCKIPTQNSTTSAVGGYNSTAMGGATNAGRTVMPLSEPQFGTRERGGEGCPDGRTVLVNQMTGSVFVRAMPEELRSVEELLHAMQVSIDKQVILEAKIIDVQLNSGAQQGINWSVFQNGVQRASLGADTTTVNAGANGGALVSGTTLGAMLGNGLIGTTGTAASAGLGLAFQVRNFAAMLNFLQTQGAVNVLSSPRIATINNQKAVLKVGTDEQYVTGFDTNSNTVTTTGGTVTNQPTPIYSTFFSGISLDVTPQIDDEDNITLHVHPLVSQVTEVQKNTINNMTLPFASNNISETDSVVKVKDGQIVVIGGLMTDSYSDTRSKIPGAGDVPAAGALFRKGGQSHSKRELVIMIKPTVVRGDGAWSDEISASQQRIESLDDVPSATQ
jgi:MSHA biogenesis protein MshL